MRFVLRILKYLLIIVFSSLVLWFLVSLGLYRIISNGEPVESSGLVHYKYVEFNLDNRQIFEDVMGNRVARLIGLPPFYLSEIDRSKIWQDNPHEMFKKGYTYKVKIHSKPLLFGGLAYSKLVSIELVNEKPTISK